MFACLHTIKSHIRLFDLFGEPVNRINIKGETVFKTTFGGLVSLAIWICLAAFMVVRSRKLINRDDPIIYEVKQAVNSDEIAPLVLKDNQFEVGLYFFV